jgi:hypothetical protein
MMKKFGLLGSLLAGALLALPAAAADLAYDDGAFEALQAPAATIVFAVDFALPSTDVYALDTVSFYLDADAAGAYPLAVSIWDKDLALVATRPFPVVFGTAGWYSLDLSSAGVVVDGSFRVGVAADAAATDPQLGVDDTLPPGHSFDFDTVAVAWTAKSVGNYGIRASAHLVPVLTCEGFLPPLSRGTIQLNKGGRTLPLKALLADGAGAPVTKAGVAAPPVVQVLFTPIAGTTQVDVSASVAPAGRSNLGNAFRLGGGKWMYNLKTSKLAAPGTYTILLGTGDAAEYQVDPACSATVAIAGPKPKKNPKSK